MKGGRSSLEVLRPVPQPSSVIVIGDDGNEEGGEGVESWAKAVSRRGVMSVSSMACRMLLSVS